MATNFQQETYASGDGKFIYIVKTTASNIRLASLYEECDDARQLSATSYTGINGSFFERSGTYKYALHNIAVQDGVSLGLDVYNENGPLNGTENQETGHGLIAWSGSRLISKNEETLYANLDASFKGRGAWVQGGIAMRLGYTDWLTGAVASHVDGEDYFTANELRSALVVNKVNNDVYLIVTSSAMTAASFRTRIQEYLGITDGSADNSTYAGILLDGGNSTQLIYRSPYNVKTTVPSNLFIRAVPQAIVLRDDT